MWMHTFSQIMFNTFITVSANYRFIYQAICTMSAHFLSCFCVSCEMGLIWYGKRINTHTHSQDCIVDIRRLWERDTNKLCEPKPPPSLCARKFSPFLLLPDDGTYWLWDIFGLRPLARTFSPPLPLSRASHSHCCSLVIKTAKTNRNFKTSLYHSCRRTIVNMPNRLR